MKKLFRVMVSVVCLWIPLKVCAQSLPDSVAKKVDKLFAKWNSPNSPGCVIGIVRNDSLIYAKGYGQANIEYNIPNSPETIYHMASVSKQFAAYSIVLLAKQGKLQLDDDIHKYLPWFPDLKEKITDSKVLISKAIQDLRDLSKSLNTDNIAAMGLLKVIGYELDMIRKTGFQTYLEVSGEEIKMEPQKELILFRIVQETLNNIIKHAEAKTIKVNMVYSTDKFQLTINDDGRGVDLTPLNEKAGGDFGLGIRNMHNRAKLIGADFNMNSRIGAGTTVSLIVPLNIHNL